MSAPVTTTAVEDHNPTSPSKTHLPDPALDIQNQHHHPHLHHSAAAHAAHNPDSEPSYVIDTHPDDKHVPPQFSHDVEKDATALEGAPEKGDDAVEGGSMRSVRKPGKVGVYYRKYKPFVHMFIFALFTGYVTFPSSPLVSYQSRH